ncbi:MAG TPA: HU family DNA-binding protein [Myxococcales bacterium]|nr:HU family DNA-binding protein [Myxococcales bacterium]HIN85795.1 HU family DNA-binding protein [Myxococcales bacterium]
MTKAEFIDEVKNRRDIHLTRKQTEHVINTVFDVLSQTIRRQKKFTFPGFGVFVVRSRKARTGRDPRNQQLIQLKATKTVAFRPAPKLKNSL